jgi:protease II
MSKKTTFLSSIIINLLLISCGSSKQTAYPVTSYDQTKQSISTVIDKDNKLGYTITKDNSHLYVTINTQDKITQLKMMRNGVTIFFDDEGKKNKHLSVEYPIAKENQTRDIEKIKKTRENGNQQEILQKMLASLGNDIKIIENEEERIINKELNNERISVDHKISPEGLSYTLKVPLSYVQSQSETKSIGLSIQGMKRPNTINGMTSAGGRPSGAMRGGGMRGGGKPGGMGKRPGGRGAKPDMDQIKALQSDIEIWIPIEL